MIDSIDADQIIASILDSPIETRNIEFKPSTPWNNINQQHQLQVIIKSILGMSNIKDGGRIILGAIQKPDKTFTIDGMTEQHLSTYDQDRIYQAVKAYGSPEPRFEIRNISHRGKNFIVFYIQDFLFSPVICTRNGSNTGAEPLIAGAVYTRTYKPETKKVDNETEMREIIDLAIDKEINRLSPRIQSLMEQNTPIISPPSEEEKFEDELGDLK